MTKFVGIISDTEIFEIISLIDSKKNYICSPMVTVFPYDTAKTKKLKEEKIPTNWDNADYTIKLYKDFRKGRRSSWRVHEFKTFCKVLDIDYKDTRREYKVLIKEAKKLKMFNYGK